MESAVSTDPMHCVGNNMREEACYAVSPGVRVRKEEFGLLFYNTRDSRLTFIKSGELLQIATLPTESNMITASLESAAQGRVRRLLNHLLKKGLIREA